VNAKSGCCSYHGGVCGNYCCDGTPLTSRCRDDYNPPTCDSSHLYLCNSPTSCTNAWGYWYNYKCNRYPQPSCRSDNLVGCRSQNSCVDIGGHWCDNQCQRTTCEPHCDITHCDLCLDETSCLNVGGYWCNNQCQNHNNCSYLGSNKEFYHAGDLFSLTLNFTLSCVADLYVAIKLDDSKIWFLTKDGDQGQIKITDVPIPYSQNIYPGSQEIEILSFVVPDDFLGTIVTYSAFNKSNLPLSVENLVSVVNSDAFSFLGDEPDFFALCTRVIDGDTIKVAYNSSPLTIRLYGIDAPEISQPGGNESKNFLKNFISNKMVRIEPIDHDRYGRLVGMVYYDGINISETLVSNGFAWLYERYCKVQECSLWSNMEGQARNAHIGLWGGVNPMPPWEWRDIH